MYDIEISEAKRLIDDTKRDAAAANVKTQEAEQDLRRHNDRYNQVSGLRDTDRKKIDDIQRQIAENEAVRIDFSTCQLIRKNMFSFALSLAN